MKKLLPLLFLVLTSFLIIHSCKKDDSSDETPSASVTSSANLKISIAGMVLTETNQPLSGATVTAYGQTTTTNIHGLFSFSDINVNKDRCIIKASYPQAYIITHAFIPIANSVNYTRIVLSFPNYYSINSAAPGTVTLPDNSSVQFSPNSFVTAAGTAFNGTVSVRLKHLSPDDTNFSNSIPGGDLAAQDSAGNDAVLYSYGMLGVELVDLTSGQPLQLAAGSIATIKMAIAPSQLSTAPATLPLWHFDESTSLWIQEGVAVKTGSFYTGTVSHFSWWNCDVPFEKATIKGQVVDCNGNPLPNVTVTIGGNYTLITNQNGIYTNWVPANLALTAQVLNGNNFGLLNSQIENIPPLASGQVFTVPDLVTPCPATITGTLTDCAGLPTGGMVYLSAGSGGSSYQLTSNGSFTLVAPGSTQALIEVFALNESSATTITTPIAPGVLNMDDINLCDTIEAQTYDNGFFINGNGFNNQQFIMDTTYSAGVDYSTSGANTELFVTGIDSINGNLVNITISFLGSTPGTYLPYIHIGIGGHLNYYPGAGLPSILNISQFDTVGGRIIGEFSAVLKDSVMNTVSISQGRINVRRIY